ncbi:glucosamine-6-phosphate deaminase [Paenibacillus sp. GCM10027626]|uniref:glucosamine-6-phosphate deaminase n=1 Tax=Paenibacillus sp. GCM10027626 TaxID=3273411 RepID=UPI003637B8CB
MNIRMFDSREELDAFAAQFFIDKINRKPQATLGLATGSTPIGIYENLVERYRKGDVSFSQVTTFNLDEYVGVPASNEQSYAYFMKNNLFGHIDLPVDRAFLPNGMADDLQAECAHYDGMMAGQPIDIQLLGIGHNGHIGFNEPDEALQGGTHVVTLKQETRDANARFFASMDDVPKLAITMGVGSIMKARTIMLVAKGADKADIIKQALQGPITTQCPASLLQAHPDALILLDREAGGKL